MFVPSKRFQASAIEHSSLLGPFVSYFTYNDFNYNDFTYNDFTYNDYTYNDFTYNDFTNNT